MSTPDNALSPATPTPESEPVPPRKPHTTQGLGLLGALRKPRTMPDPEVDWSSWIADIEAAASTQHPGQPDRLPHRTDDRGCACDECLGYLCEDNGVAFDRLPVIDRERLRRQVPDDRLDLEAVEYPKGYDHRRGCSRQHPVPFPCDDGTLTPAAAAARLGSGQSVLSGLERSLDNLKPLYHATGPGPDGRPTFSGWEVPDWLMQRIREALRSRAVPVAEEGLNDHHRGFDDEPEPDR